MEIKSFFLARKNDFISISELMTGIENRVFSRKEVSQLIFKESHKSLKIGITGPPGAPGGPVIPIFNDL